MFKYKLGEDPQFPIYTPQDSTSRWRRIFDDH